MNTETFWLCYGEYRGKKDLKRFLKYVWARIKSSNEEMTFKVYITDSLRGIYKSFGGEVKARYYDLIFKNKGIIEDRTADEIIDSIRGKLEEISEA